MPLEPSVGADGFEDEFRSPRLRKNALARFVSDASLVVTGLISATVTARWLGPAGKGTLSTLLYIVALASLIASLGLGDAAIVLGAGDRRRIQKLISISLPPIALASLPAIGIVLIAAWMGNWSGIAGAVVAGCLLVPIRMLNWTLINFLNASEELIRSSLIAVVQVVVEVAALVLLVALLGMGILGAVLAAVLGAGTAILLSIKALARDGFKLTPLWARHEAWTFLHLGGTLIAARVVIHLAQRFDLLLVYTIEGETSAGLYAIALTLGQIAAHTSGSLAIAAFPRLARLKDGHAWELIPRLARMGLVSALLSGVMLALFVPFAVPFLFGDRFQGAVIPTLILIVGGIAWSQLSLLTRSVAALGHQRVQFISFLSYLIAMTMLDVVLIPRWGITGAAIASVIAPTLVLVGFFSWYGRRSESAPPTAFVPRPEDLWELLGFLKSTARRSRELLLDPKRAWTD